MGCVLFEVFHHEFFHHLTECAATVIEIASAGFDKAKPIFTDYWIAISRKGDSNRIQTLYTESESLSILSLFLAGKLAGKLAGTFCATSAFDRESILAECILLQRMSTSPSAGSLLRAKGPRTTDKHLGK